jgi:acetyltransferase-like isoleucine patch superfamily enzyme
VKVFDGVNIGEDTIVGAGAVVIRDLPAFSIAAGVPARVAKSRKS